MARTKKSRSNKGNAKAKSVVPVITLPALESVPWRKKRKARDMKAKMKEMQVPLQYITPPLDVRDDEQFPVPVEFPATAAAQQPGPEHPPETQPVIEEGAGEAPSPRQAVAPAQEGAMLSGATCTWIGSPDQAVEDSASGIPLCPHCGGRLLDAGTWNTIALGLQQYEMGAYKTPTNISPRRRPGYSSMVSWMMTQGRCWKHPIDAASDYAKETGIHVDVLP